jgi:hypothetical protein
VVHHAPPVGAAAPAARHTGRRLLDDDDEDHHGPNGIAAVRLRSARRNFGVEGIVRTAGVASGRLRPSLLNSASLRRESAAPCGN